MLEHALLYQSLGLSVIPLRPRASDADEQWRLYQLALGAAAEQGLQPDIAKARKADVSRLKASTGHAKRPQLSSWEPYKHRLATRDEIAQWWREHPTAGIAIITGRISGIVAADIDSDEARRWAQAHLPPTPLHILTDRGEHWLYRHPAAGVDCPDCDASPATACEAHRLTNKVKVRTENGRIDLDIRTNGGYVCAPPTVHPSGATYQWHGELSAETLARLPVFDPKWLHSNDNPDRPTLGIMSTSPSPGSATATRPTGTLIGRLAPPRQVSSAAADLARFDQVPSSTDTGPMPSLERARRWLAKHDCAVQGQGGDAHTYNTACSLRDFGISADDAFQLMAEWNQGCSPPWSAEDLRKKVDNAYRYAQGVAGAKVRRTPTGQVLRAVQPGEASSTPDDGDPDELPVIYVASAELPRMVDEACAALGGDPDLYQRGNQLVQVRADGARHLRLLDRPPGEPAIVTVTIPRLLELMARSAEWRKWSKAGEYPVAPPDKVAQALAARPSWPFRPLEAVIEAPTLRLDGSLLTTPGYDDPTGLLFLDAGLQVPDIPKDPTREEAGEALALLRELVCDFPFAEAHHRSAAIAAVMTAVLRPAIRGKCPLFLCDASTPGSGKGLLAKLAALIATGRPVPVLLPAERDDQTKTAITSLALTGARLVLYDEVSTLQSAALQSALTADVWADRAYHTQQMIQVPLLWVWFAAGNNVSVVGDMDRRVVPIRLEPDVERPEERTGFAHDPIEDWALANRGALVRAILIMARAFIIAGRPRQQLTPFGSFQGWSDLVRQTLVWLGEPDPCAGRQAVQAAAAELRGPIEPMLQAWRDRFGDDAQRLADAIKVVRSERQGNPALFEALLELAPTKARDDIDTERLAKLFRRLRRRVFGGLILDGHLDRKRIVLWRVASASAGDAGDRRGSLQSLPQPDLLSDSASHDNNHEHPRQSPASPAPDPVPEPLAAKDGGQGEEPAAPTQAEVQAGLAEYELEYAVRAWLARAGAMSADLWRLLASAQVPDSAWQSCPWPGAQGYQDPLRALTAMFEPAADDLVDRVCMAEGARVTTAKNVLGTGRTWRWHEARAGQVDAWLQWLRDRGVSPVVRGKEVK